MRVHTVAPALKFPPTSWWFPGITHWPELIGPIIYEYAWLATYTKHALEGDMSVTYFFTTNLYDNDLYRANGNKNFSNYTG